MRGLCRCSGWELCQGPLSNPFVTSPSLIPIRVTKLPPSVGRSVGDARVKPEPNFTASEPPPLIPIPPFGDPQPQCVDIPPRHPELIPPHQTTSSLRGHSHSADSGRTDGRTDAAPQAMPPGDGCSSPAEMRSSGPNLMRPPSGCSYRRS